MTRTPAPPVHLAMAGDPRAWEELVTRYSGLLRAIARDFRLTPEQAADATQTAWMSLVEDIGKVRDPEKLGGWLASTMRRECIRLVNRQRREQPTGDWDGDRFGHSASADVTVLQAERHALLWSAVKRLPARQRQVVVALTADPPPSYEQVGAELSMAVGTIGPTRRRALRRLRQLLAEGDMAGSGPARSTVDVTAAPRYRPPRQRGATTRTTVDGPTRRTRTLTLVRGGGAAPC